MFPLLNILINPFWGADSDLVTFPLFPWLVFPVVGMICAVVYKQNPDEKMLVKNGIWAGGLLFTVGMILLVIDFDHFFNDYGQQQIGGLMAISGFVFLWGLLIHWLE